MENKNNVTELVFIIDRSGSMSGFEEDTAGGFNSMIGEQRKKEGEVLVSAVLFDDVCEVLHDRVDIARIEKMHPSDCMARGCTALLDAVGGAIDHIGRIHKYLPESLRPKHTIFVITTDGMENSSRRYGASKIREMISRQKVKYGWEFIFVGANIDSLSVAENIGISRERAANYKQTRRGFDDCYRSMNAFVSMAREESLTPCDASWKSALEENEVGGKDDVK